MLVRFLAGRDVPCPGCGYNARDLRVPRCPECGDKLALSLASSEQRPACFLAGLVPLAMGAGFGLITGAWGFSEIGICREVVTLLAGGVVHGALLFGWIGWWSRIRRHSRAARLMALTGCYVAVLSFIVVFDMMSFW